MHYSNVVGRKSVALLSCLLKIIIGVRETKSDILDSNISFRACQMEATHVIESIHISTDSSLLKILTSLLKVSSNGTIPIRHSWVSF
jgi:hypothetical protein